jgi:phospholipase C
MMLGGREERARAASLRNVRRVLPRRKFLIGSMLGGAAAAVAAGFPLLTSSPNRIKPLYAAQPGQLPFPDRPPGTDMLPAIDHIVVLMLENHSFDNILGLLPGVDGFTLDAQGNPLNWNPDASGKRVRAFPSPTACRAFSTPSQSWNQSHTAYAGGTNSGFVLASGPASMAYYPAADVPFTVGLARTFPVSDRYFSSMLGPTFPNRRFLISGTSMGMINDFPSWNSLLSTVSAKPPNGTIFDSLNAHGISWKNYNYGISTLWLYPYLLSSSSNRSKIVGIDQFFSDARNGTLPSFSLIDPNLVNFIGNSEGEGDDIVFGDQLLAKVVQALVDSPNWPKTLFIWTYDEAGGYYDHVPPPRAPIPDSVPPQLTSSDVPGGFDVYGFRVPFGLVSPYARKGYVSHQIMDHTSILKLVEIKWNLPFLTYRDANAVAPLDMLDFAHPPAFLDPPAFPPPASTTWWGYLECEWNSSQNPPPGYVS